MTLLLVATAAAAQPAPGDTTPVDYRDPAAWICRPGVGDGICGVDAKTATPPIDCFYVYPTASLDPTLYSDMRPDQAETGVVRAHVAALAARCRPFVPAYHQITITALRWRIEQRPQEHPTTSDIAIPYRDVLAAWRDYLRHDNGGRGVVLVGHSQGSRILARLVADEIDGKPAQRLLVAAYLAGTTELDAATFRSVPPCRAAEQTGCVVAWSSYPEGYDGVRIFGGGRPGVAPLCVNPAAFGGGRALLKPLLPATDPPLADGAFSAECVADGQGAVLRIRAEAGPQSAHAAASLVPSRAGPTWGLHPLDIGLVQGNVVEAIGRQGAAWGRGQ